MSKIRKNLEKILSKKEIMALIGMITILGGAAIYDWRILRYKLNIPNIIKSLNCSELINILFQVQASVSTLGIAIIALLSEASKQYILGNSVSNYIMNEKRSIFKHKRIIVAELVFIVLNYIFIAFKLYNLAMVIFFISVGLVIFMIFDIFVVFNGSRKVKDEIEKYYINYFKKLHKKECENKSVGILDNLAQDINWGIESDNSAKIKEDFDYLLKIFETMISVNSIYQNSVILKKWNEICSDKCKVMFDKKNYEKSMYVINFIYEVYKKCNEYNDRGNNYIYLRVWDNIENNFFKSISIHTSELVMENYNFFCLHRELYKNTYVEVGEQSKLQKNNYYLNVFSSRNYYAMFFNNKNSLDEKGSARSKKNLFDNIKYIIEYEKFYDNEYVKNKMLYSELSNYTKVLIDNFEANILEETFFDLLSNMYYYPGNEKNIYNKYFFVIMIYLYYLSEKETLVPSDLKEFVGKLLLQHQNKIRSFFYDMDIMSIKLNKEFIQDLKYTLKSWEIMHEKEAKWLIMDMTVDNFLLFFILERCWNLDDLTENVIPLISEQEFIFYDSYVGVKKDDTKTAFKNFLELFYGKNVEEKEISNKIDLLETVIANIYKDRELKKSQKDKLSDEDIKDICSKIKYISIEQINKVINIFSNRVKDVSIKNNNFKILGLSTYVIFLDDNHIKNDIKELVNTNIVTIVANVLFEHILAKRISYDDKNKKILNEFFHLVNSVDIELNTLIGYRNWFYSYEEEDKFKEFEKNKIKIKANQMGNIVIAIDNRKFYINLLNVKVTVSDFSKDEILKDLKKDDEGKYLYNITNNTYIPFEEEELLKYVSNEKKKVVIEGEFEYGFSDENVGVGVFME